MKPRPVHANNRAAPLSVREVAALFATATFRWWIAGGWGIDLHLEAQTRPHIDIDILILRPDQISLRRVLEGWDLHAADPPGSGSLRPWDDDERLEPPVHEIWCRAAPDLSWQLEIMLGEVERDDWVFRNNAAVRRSIDTLGSIDHNGVPYIAPEILLLFKAKNPRPKDEMDFDAVLPGLTNDARKWLREAIDSTHPTHPWSKRLAPRLRAMGK